MKGKARITTLFICLLTMSAGVFASNGASVRALGRTDINPVDTIAFTASRAESEVDPNNGNFCFTLYGAANGLNWKMQMDYYADSLAGTFGDTEFRLPKAGGSSTNWIRKDDGSYKTYYATTIDATVSENDGATTIDLAGYYRDRVGGDTVWHFVRVHADILPIAAKTTTQLDLGRVAVVPNTFLGYMIMEAESADYRLAFGISGISALHAGTFYRTEMIRPDLVEKATGDTVRPIFAQLEVKDSTVSGLYRMRLDLFDTDSNLYRIAMHTDVITVTDTVEIECGSATIQDVVAMYGFYQFVGQSAGYQVALAVKPGVISESLTTIVNDSVDLSYTQVLRLSDGALIRVQQASATVEVDSTTTIWKETIYADLIGTDDVLYRVTFPFGGSSLPVATDTTVVECGDWVGRVDYTHGAGWMGLVLGNDSADIHITVYNGLSMRGSYTSDMFVYDEPKAYVTTYGEGGVDFRFSDVQAAEMRMDSIGDTVRIELDAVTVTGRMFRFHARLVPTRALTGGEQSYSVNRPLMDDGLMVALRSTTTGSTGPAYRLQLQRSNAWDNETGQVTGDRYEIWDFVFSPANPNGIAGEYGYAAGTLEDGRKHMIVEHGTEIYLMPMAGTLKLEVTGTVTVPATVLGKVYHTHLYAVEAHIAAENGMVYHLSGENYLLCVDYETGAPIELSEAEQTALREWMEREGYGAVKVMEQGRVVIRTTEGCYDMDGRKRQ